MFRRTGYKKSLGALCAPSESMILEGELPEIGKIDAKSE